MPGSRTGAARVRMGVALMSGATLMLPLMDVFAKLLAETMAPLQVAVARFVGQAGLALLAALLTRQLAGLRPPGNLWPHLARGFCLGGATLFFFTALQFMAIPDALAIFFVQPMILTALGVVVLREKVDVRRLAAAGVGFAGALVIIRPGSGTFGLGALLPLGAALLFSCYLLLTRHLSERGSMLAAQFTAGVAGAGSLGVALALATLLGLPGASASLPVAADWPMLLGLGLTSFVGHGLVVAAFRRAPAGVLAPLDYLEMVSATVASWLIFGSVPGAATWAGMALIVASGLYIIRRERG
ncbi:MAG: DMT family transporter [Dongiaceae bacterium]